MNMKEFSEVTGLSAHTIRYYEKIGLLRHIERTKSGHRTFSKNDLVWIEFITRLKQTGMPLQQILKYADLREKGNSTAIARMDLLKHHSEALEERLRQETQHLKKLKEKIEYYENLILSQNA